MGIGSSKRNKNKADKKAKKEKKNCKSPKIKPNVKSKSPALNNNDYRSKNIMRGGFTRTSGVVFTDFDVNYDREVEIEIDFERDENGFGLHDFKDVGNDCKRNDEEENDRVENNNGCDYGGDSRGGCDYGGDSGGGCDYGGDSNYD